MMRWLKKMIEESVGVIETNGFVGGVLLWLWAFTAGRIQPIHPLGSHCGPKQWQSGYYNRAVGAARRLGLRWRVTKYGLHIPSYLGI